MEVVEVVVEADAGPRLLPPVFISEVVGRRLALLEGNDRRTVRSAFKRLDFAEVRDVKHLEVIPLLTQLEAAEAVAGAFGLEKGLGNDEPEPPAAV